MSDESLPIGIDPAATANGVSGKAGEITSPKPPPLADLTGSEKRVWDYICESLRGVGIEHLTAGIAIKVICRTYVDWMKAIALCDQEGRYAKGKRGGGSYELPHSYTEKQLKKDLLKWLPEACLTIPSLQVAKSKLPEGPKQDDLFDDLVGHGSADKSSYSSKLHH